MQTLERPMEERPMDEQQRRLLLETLDLWSFVYSQE